MKRTSPTKILKPSQLRSNGHPPDNTDDDMAERSKAVQELLKNRSSTILPFPEKVFPEVVQRLMKVFYTSSGLPFEYYYAALLGATAILMGNKYRIRAKSDFIQPQILYLAIVGKSGLGKSPPMKIIFGPIYDIEARLAEKNNEMLRAYAAQRQEAQENKQSFEMEEPNPSKILLGQITIEALFDVLAQNPLGVGMVDEELTGFLEGMGQYKSGKSNELQYWLKLFDNPKTDSITRKGNKELVIRNGNVTIFGGVQPGLLTAIANGKMTSIGLPQRFQFVVPEKQDIPDWNEIEPDATVFSKYKAYIDFIWELPGRIERKIQTNLYNSWNIERIDMGLTPKAKEMYVEFYRKLRLQMNEEVDDKKFGQLSKLRSYCLRYALILEVMHFSAKHFEDHNGWWKLSKDEQLAILDKHEVGDVAMSGAIALIEYFISTSMTVLARFDNVLNTYPEEVRIWYNGLPDMFKSSFAVEIGKAAGLARSTVYNYLNDAVLFKKILETNMIVKRIVTE